MPGKALKPMTELSPQKRYFSGSNFEPRGPLATIQQVWVESTLVAWPHARWQASLPSFVQRLSVVLLTAR
jgi:hypothetical protein